MRIIEEHYWVDESIVGKDWWVDGLSEWWDPRWNKWNKADLLDAMHMTSEEEDMEVDFADVFTKVRKLQDIDTIAYKDKLEILKNIGILFTIPVEDLRGEKTLFDEDFRADLIKVSEGSVSNENLIDDMFAKLEELIKLMPTEDAIAA